MPFMNSITVGVCESCGKMGEKNYNSSENTVYCPKCNDKYNVVCSGCNSVYDKRHSSDISLVNGKYLCKNCSV